MTQDDIRTIERLRTTLESHGTQMADLSGVFRTWQETRCLDHHERLEQMENNIVNIRLEQTKIIAKSAGVVAAVVFIVNGMIAAAAIIQIKGMFPDG